MDLSWSWAQDLDTLWAEAWRALETPTAQSRRIVLASVDPSGAPQARTLVLREADGARATLDLHTDSQTVKINELAQDPRACIVFWDEARALQLRLSGRVEIITGSEAQAAWDKVPPDARPNYGVTPPPAHPIPLGDAYTRLPDISRFAVLRLNVDRLDAVVLCTPSHRRAAYESLEGVPNKFKGHWLAP